MYWTVLVAKCCMLGPKQCKVADAMAMMALSYVQQLLNPERTINQTVRRYLNMI